MNDLSKAMETKKQRRTFILEKIRAGMEMDVELATEIYSPERQLPKGTQLLRFCLSVHQLNFPIISRLSESIIKSYLPSPKCQFVSGFKFLIGNIVSDDASLFDTCFVDYADIYIGRGTGFSYGNMVITSAHDPIDMKTVRASEIIIGENVWITSRVTILPGVHIGRNSIIGAGSVVTRDIPPNVFAAGVPARPIKKVNRG